jgi:hypothetical protein
MKITSIHSSGVPIVIYDGHGDSLSLRNTFKEYCDAFANSGIDFNTQKDHPGRELGIARTIQALANSYVASLEEKA